MNNYLVTLLYHDFSDNKAQIFEKDNPMYTTSKERFQRQITWLKQKQFCFIAPRDILNLTKRYEKQNNNNFCLLTFDGPYERWDIPYKILLERKIPALFYVTTGWVGNNHPRINNKTIQGGIFVLVMSKFSTVPVSTSFVVWITSLPAVISSSKVTAACLFSLPIWALLFTVGPSEPPNRDRGFKPQPDKKRAKTTHLITPSIQNVGHR